MGTLFSLVARHHARRTANALVQIDGHAPLMQAIALVSSSGFGYSERLLRAALVERHFLGEIGMLLVTGQD